MHTRTHMHARTHMCTSMRLCMHIHTHTNMYASMSGLFDFSVKPTVVHEVSKPGAHVMWQWLRTHLLEGSLSHARPSFQSTWSVKIFSIKVFGRWDFDEMYFQTSVSSEIIQSFQSSELNKRFMLLIGIHEERYQHFILTSLTNSRVS